MAQDNCDVAPSIDPKSIKLGSSNEITSCSDKPDSNKGVVAGQQNAAATELDIDFSRNFEGYDWSEHAKVKRLIDTILDEYGVWYKGDASGERIRNRNVIKQYLTHLVLEAYKVHRAQPGMMLGVPLGKDRYKKTGDRYWRKHISSYDSVKHATDFLVAADYLEMPFGKGEWHPDMTKRKTTRYRTTERLIDLCDEFGINPYMIVPYKNPEVT